MKPRYEYYSKILKHLPEPVEEKRMEELFRHRLVDGLKDIAGIRYNVRQLVALLEFRRGTLKRFIGDSGELAYQDFFRSLPPDVRIELRAAKGRESSLNFLPPEAALALDRKIRITRGIDGHSLHKLLVSIEIFPSSGESSGWLRYGEVSLEDAHHIFFY